MHLEPRDKVDALFTGLKVERGEQGRTITFKKPLRERLPAVRYVVAKYRAWKAKKFLNRADQGAWEKAIDSEVSHIKNQLDERARAEKEFLQRHREAYLSGNLANDMATSIEE